MADLLDSIQRQVKERMDELRPVALEYERLKSADTALRAARGSVPADREGERVSPPRRRRRSAGRRTSAPASREANRERVLAIVAERPGITKAELKAAAGLTGAGVGQNLRRLVDSGRVREEALPSGEAGYRLGETGTRGAGQDAAPGPG